MECKFDVSAFIAPQNEASHPGRAPKNCFSFKTDRNTNTHESFQTRREEGKQPQPQDFHLLFLEKEEEGHSKPVSNTACWLVLLAENSREIISCRDLLILVAAAPPHSQSPLPGVWLRLELVVAVVGRLPCRGCDSLVQTMSRTKTTTTTTRRRTRNGTTNVWNQLLNLSSSLDEQDDTNNTADAHWSWLDQKRPASPQRTARTKRPHQRIIVRTKRALEEQARYGISNALVLTTLQQGMILIGQRPLELQQDDDDEDDESSLEHDNNDDDEHDFPELQAPCHYDPTSTKKKASSPLRNTSTLESNLCFRYENLDTGTVVLVQEYPAASHGHESPSRGSPHGRRRKQRHGGSPHRMRNNEESHVVVVRVLNVYPLHAATDQFEPSASHETSHSGREQQQQEDEETEWMWDQEQDPSLNNNDHSTSASAHGSHMQQQQQQSSLSPTSRRNAAAAAAVVVERHEEEEPDWYRDPNDDSDDEEEEEEESLDPNGENPNGVDVQPANEREPVSPPRRQRHAEHLPLLERNDGEGQLHPQPLMEEEPALRPLVQDHQDPDAPANRPQQQGNENHAPPAAAARPANPLQREAEENPEWTSPPSPLRPRPPPPQQQQDRLQEHQVRGPDRRANTRHANGRQQVPDAQGSLEEPLLMMFDHENEEEEEETVEDLLGSVTTTSRDEDDDATQQLVLAMLGVVAVVGLWLVAGEAAPSSLW